MSRRTLRISPSSLAAVLLVLVVSGPFTQCASRAAYAGALREYKIKAAFLYNFTKFISWPASDTDGAEFLVCLLSSSSVTEVISNALRGKKANGAPIRTRALSDVASMRGCHIVFLGHAQRPHLGGLRGERVDSILVVSEADEFGSDISMINLVRADDRIQLEIDRAAAQRAGLKLSSKLLSLARIRRSGEDERGPP